MSCTCVGDALVCVRLSSVPRMPFVSLMTEHPHPCMYTKNKKKQDAAAAAGGWTRRALAMGNTYANNGFNWWANAGAEYQGGGLQVRATFWLLDRVLCAEGSDTRPAGSLEGPSQHPRLYQPNTKTTLHFSINCSIH